MGIAECAKVSTCSESVEFANFLIQICGLYLVCYPYWYVIGQNGPLARGGTNLCVYLTESVKS